MGLKTTNVPQIPDVPTGIDPNLSLFLERMKEAIEILFGRGNELDKAITVRGLQNAGLHKMALKSGTDLVYRFDDLASVERDHSVDALLWPNGD
uniref:Uncharacterized protein n=1 Tax=viral metagenome TaxID=1070528 RepID=A0A6M3LLK5_9ZZZZ